MNQIQNVSKAKSPKKLKLWYKRNILTLFSERHNCITAKQCVSCNDTDWRNNLAHNLDPDFLSFYHFLKLFTVTWGQHCCRLIWLKPTNTPLPLRNSTSKSWTKRGWRIKQFILWPQIIFKHFSLFFRGWC